MKDSMSIMLAGVQGDGFVTTGDVLIKALSRAGYFTYGFRTFSSRIKGGESTYTIDISLKEVSCKSDRPEILVAFDQNSILLHRNEVQDNGLLLYDDSIEFSTKNNTYSSLPLPFTSMAKAHGSTIMKNTVAVGILAKLLNLPINFVKEALISVFSKKNKNLLENFSILEEAYNYELSITSISNFNLISPLANQALPSMIGNEAIGFGALMGGCRFMSAYPITPASEIMEYLVKHFPKYNGILVQTEDEISAINMALGASYGGCRAMTATSGPGISLMMEGIGLAGMAEIPVVVVDSQRGGPSTGLPTKMEQSDILSLYNGPHGEIPSIILTPYSVETCFYYTIEAFNLADYYQCPVFILSDLTLALSRQTIHVLTKESIKINRGKVFSQHESENLEDKSFDRFAYSQDGISTRSFPGQVGGVHHVTGIEHNQYGKPGEDPHNRTLMMDKRLKKTKELRNEDGIDLFGDLDSEVLILSIGSNYGVIKRTVSENKFKVAYGMFHRLKPFPSIQLKTLLDKYSHILIIENNSTGQLVSLIKSELGYSKIESFLKYDGTPFSMGEVKEKIRELI